MKKIVRKTMLLLAALDEKKEGNLKIVFKKAIFYYFEYY